MPARTGRSRRVTRRAIHALGAQASTMQAPTPAPIVAAAQPRTPEYYYWLMQRLELGDGSRSGFDKYFRLDYMGSVEFEVGTVPESLKRIRSAGNIVVRAVQVTRGGVTRTVYFVGPSKDLEVKIADFEVWFAQDYPRAKEPTYLDELFTRQFVIPRRRYT